MKYLLIIMLLFIGCESSRDVKFQAKRIYDTRLDYYGSVLLEVQPEIYIISRDSSYQPGDTVPETVFECRYLIIKRIK